MHVGCSGSLAVKIVFTRATDPEQRVEMCKNGERRAYRPLHMVSASRAGSRTPDTQSRKQQTNSPDVDGDEPGELGQRERQS